MKRGLIFALTIGLLWQMAKWPIPIGGSPLPQAMFFGQNFSSSSGIAYVNSVSQGLGTSGGTTSGVNMVGANFLVACLTFYTPSTQTAFSSSPSNTWNKLTVYDDSVFVGVSTVIYYAESASSGSSQTFTANGAFSAISVMGFSGVKVASSIDKQGGAGTSGSNVTTIQPGSITPSVNRELVVTCGSNLAAGGITVSPSNYTQLANIAYNGTWVSNGSAYWIQTTATATNPTWTFSSSLAATAIASFEAQ